MNVRLKTVRKALKLTQVEFGRRLGVTDGAISNLEKGERNLTDQMILAICRGHGINETWLRTGIGDMFTHSEESAIDRLTQEYGLDDFAACALLTYQKLTPSNRDAVKQYVLNLAASYGAELSQPLMPQVIIEGQTVSDPAAAAELVTISKELSLEKRAAEELSVSPLVRDA